MNIQNTRMRRAKGEHKVEWGTNRKTGMKDKDIGRPGPGYLRPVEKWPKVARAGQLVKAKAEHTMNQGRPGRWQQSSKQQHVGRTSVKEWPEIHSVDKALVTSVLRIKRSPHKED